MESERILEPLKTGDSVQIQNQSGNKPKQWHNTGVVTEVLPNRQYYVIVDGSRRITVRNRKFLRKIVPVCRQPAYPILPHQTQVDKIQTSIPILTSSIHPPIASCDDKPINNKDQMVEHHTKKLSPIILHDPEDIAVMRGDEVHQLVPPYDVNDKVGTNKQKDIPLEQLHEQVDDNNQLRRSTRSRKMVKLFTPKMRGKTHE